MENASKALIMAGSVLIGVMLISLMVYCFSLFADYAKQYSNKQEALQLLQYNSQFTKYNDQDNPEVVLTAYDMVDIITLAQNNNAVYGYNSDNTTTASYITVHISGFRNHAEKATKEEIQNFLKSSLVTDVNGNITIQKYKCVTMQPANGSTDRINFMLFAQKH